MNDRPNDDWEQLFEQMPIDRSARQEHRERLRARVLAAFDRAGPPVPQRLGLKQIGEFVMRHKILHWTAASIVIAFAIWFAQSGSKPAFALEEMVENFVRARTARYDMTVKVTGGPTHKMKAFYLEPSHFRQELSNGAINIVDWQAGKMVGLEPTAKLATVFNLINFSTEAKQKTQANQFEQVRESLKQALDDPETKVESLGEQEMDGRTVLGFRFRTGSQPMTVWADPETKFPVRIEATMTGPPETQVVMTNYEFNIDLDKSLFSTEIPEGYRVVEADVDTSAPTEAEFINALRLCSKANDDKFPDGLDAVAIARHIGKYVAEQNIGKDTPPSADLIKKTLRIGRGIRFALTLPAEADAHFAGAGIGVGDPDKPIFWYRPVDSTSYRVIYADLSVKDADTAPQVADAQKLVP